MPQSTTLILLSQTSHTGTEAYDVTGEQQQAAAYYIGTKNLQTVNMKVSLFRGTILLQATLATDPQEDDWFTVYTVVGNYPTMPFYTAITTIYTSYNQVDGQNYYTSLNPEADGTTLSTYANVRGSFVYMRALVKDFTTGVVEHIKLSY